jgi:Ca2+-binding EF-hand superfamily protein
MNANEKLKQRLQASLRKQSSGLLGLANLFKEYDTDASGALSWEEFCGALKKCGLAPSNQDIRALFLELDRDGNNEISYDEFISSMRSEMSEKRKILLERCFEKIDSDHDGTISMTDIGKAINPRNHPEVKAGRVSVNNLIQDFFNSFGTVSDTGYVNFEQFTEYYANIAAFEEDDAFIETMSALWGLSQSTATSLKSYASVNHQVGGNVTDNTDAGPGVQTNLDKLREQLIARGARGMVGLQRKFRIMDDDGSRSLSLVEFKKAIRECALSLTDLQLSQLFEYFDKDRSGSIDFDEFIVGVRVSSSSYFIEEPVQPCH